MSPDDPPEVDPDVDPDDLPDEPAPRHPTDGVDLAREIAAGFARGRPASRPRRRRPQPKEPPRSSSDDPSPIGNHLRHLISSQGWETGLSAQRIYAEWPSVVGSEVAQHCEITDYTDGEVAVQADSTAWATQLKLLAPRVVAKLNEVLGDGSVVRLEIRGPQGPSWKTGRRSIRNARGPRDTYG